MLRISAATTISRRSVYSMNTPRFSLILPCNRFRYLFNAFMRYPSDSITELPVIVLPLAASLTLYYLSNPAFFASSMM